MDGKAGEGGGRPVEWGSPPTSPVPGLPFPGCAPLRSARCQLVDQVLSLYTPNLPSPVCSAGPTAGPELLLQLAAYASFLGLLKRELRCDVSGCPLPAGRGWGRAPPGPKEQNSAELSVVWAVTPVSLPPPTSGPAPLIPQSWACAGRTL